MRRHRARYFRVLNDGFPAKYGRAIARVADAAVGAYRSVLKLDIPSFYCNERIRICLRLDPSIRHPRLFFQPALLPSINYCVGDVRSLRSPVVGGPHHVYGICHELGHLALFMVSESSSEVDSGVSEAVADFLASSILRRLGRTLGTNAWPDAYEYWKVDGIPDFAAIISGHRRISIPRSKDAFEAARWLFLRVAARYGVGAVARAIRGTRKEGRCVFLGSFKAFRIGDFWNALGRETSTRWLTRHLRVGRLIHG